MTVTSLHGIAEANAGAVQSMTSHQGTSLWYLDPARGPLEIMDPGVFGRSQDVGAQNPGGDPASFVPPTQRKITEDAQGGAERRRGLEIKRGVAARVGPYFCVFPATSALTIIADPGQGQCGLGDGRRPGDCVVLDLALLLGVCPNKERGRAIVVKRGGRRTLIVRADDVVTVSPENVWYPLPTVPARFRDLFAAIGYDGNRFYFLVREEALLKRPTPMVSALAQRAFLGFVPHPCPSPPALAVSP